MENLLESQPVCHGHSPKGMLLPSTSLLSNAFIGKRYKNPIIDPEPPRRNQKGVPNFLYNPLIKLVPSEMAMKFLIGDQIIPEGNSPVERTWETGWAQCSDLLRISVARAMSYRARGALQPQI